MSHIARMSTASPTTTTSSNPAALWLREPDEGAITSILVLACLAAAAVAGGDEDKSETDPGGNRPHRIADASHACGRDRDERAGAELPRPRER